MAEQRIIITGGARNIGRGIALAFVNHNHNASVVIADIDAEEGRKTAEQINRLGGQGIFYQTDVSSPHEVSRLIDVVVEQLEGIDVLVNNAGVAHGPSAERHLLDTDEEMWDRLIDSHLKGTFLCSRLVARHMVSQNEEGCIVNVSSCGAVRAHRNRVAYDAAKGAIEAITRAMALDLAPWKIRVNAIAPGVIAVEGRSAIGNESNPDALIPLGRLGTPSDLGEVAAFLASSSASYITGQIITVDGGLTAQLRPPLLDSPLEPSATTVSHQKAVASTTGRVRLNFGGLLN